MKLELITNKAEKQGKVNPNDEFYTPNYVSEVQKQEDELFTTALRTMAEPPIKGEITKGKLRWRGIKIIRQQIGLDSYSWLEQRGKQISPKFHIEAKLPDSNVG